MRILIAPNAFKGSLSVLEAAQAFAKGARRALPDAELDLMPIADGGDGLMDCLLAARGGRKVLVTVRGPLGADVRAPLALLPDGSACVEMARAVGLALVPPARRRPLLASTYGAGQLVVAALDRGARKVIFGLGGTASSDGGAGLAQALGARLLDARGREIGPGAKGLLDLARIDASGLRRAKVVGVSDVVNPLLGPRGSAATYGPQKGASPADVRLIERALGRLARVAAMDLRVAPAARRGAGAAGGTGFGLMAFLGAELVSGAAFVLDACGARERLAKADAVLTGEGKLDATSFYGKAPVELLRLARKPAAVVCGAIEPAARPRLTRLGVRSAVSLTDAGATPELAMRQAARWAAKAAELAVKGLALGALLLAAVPARAADTAAIDAAYFRRDEPGQLGRSLALCGEAPSADLAWRRCRALVRRGEGKTGKKERLADFDAARQDCERAAAAPGAPADAHFWLAVALGRYGQTKGIFKSLSLIGPIRKEAKAALALDPRHGGAWHLLAEVDWQVPGFAGGDKKRALSEFEKALELSPKHSANYVPLAQAYLKYARTDDARKTLDRLAALEKAESDDPPQLADDQKEGAALRAALK